MPGPRSPFKAPPPAAPASDSPAFDWLVALACGWFVVGMFVDAYAHHHGLPESFWTPWHDLLYSGFFATAAVLLPSFLVAGPGGSVRAGAAADPAPGGGA